MTEAVVTIFVSNRKIAKLAKAADLGFSDIGYREPFVITYRDDDVTEDRVLKALEKTCEDMNLHDNEFYFSNPKVVSISPKKDE